MDIGSLEGLSRLSFGNVATAAGRSKAGVQTLFKTKEALQLATVDHARDLFIGAVIEPARTAPHGAERLRALIEHWIAYAEQPLFAGGCFRTANLAEFDSRPGPVRDALARDLRDWAALLTAEFRYAGASDPELAAFQLDAVLCLANTALRMGDTGATARVRSTLESLLAG